MNQPANNQPVVQRPATVRPAIRQQPVRQRTIRAPVSLSGRGLWSGARSSVRFLPAGPDTGVVFRKNGACIRVREADCVQFERGLELVQDRTSVRSVEHLLAALYGLAIDNLVVEVQGDEIPLADGSALPFAELVASAGIVEQPAPRAYYRLRRPFVLARNGSGLVVLPHNRLRIGFLYSVPSPALKRTLRRWLDLVVEPDSFLQRIAPARTFGPHADPDRLKDMLDFEIRAEGEFLYPAQFRSRDEPVCHKVLDLLGGLALLGRPLRAAIVSWGSGHRDHLRFVNIITRRRNGHRRN